MDENFFEPQQQVADESRGPTQHLPAAENAEQLEEEAGWRRLVIEARLLAGQSPQEIEKATGTPADVIEAFAEMHFPYVEMLSVWILILRAAIPARPDDFDETLAPFLRAMGYFSGLAPLEETLTVLGPNAENLSAKKVDPSVRQALNRIRRAIRLFQDDPQAGIRRLVYMRSRRAPQSRPADSNRGRNGFVPTEGHRSIF